MKILISTFLGLVTLSATLYAQGFVEEFRSEPGRRPPASSAWYAYGTTAFQVLDINGNGAPDMPFMLGQSLAVYDGKTQESILETPVPIGFINEKLKNFGFYEFYEQANKVYEATHLVVAWAVFEPNNRRISIINAETGEIVWANQNASLIAVADPDNDDRPEIIFEDIDTKQVVMVGWGNGEADSPLHQTQMQKQDWPVAASQNYTLSLKFESGANQHLAYDASLVTNIDGMDVNGDGIPEIVMLIEDSNGEPAGMIVRNGATREIKWQFEFPSGSFRSDILNGFHGFFDANGDGQREAIFGNRTAVTFDKTVHRIDENIEIQAVHDVDNDGYADLIGRGLQDNTVQVWGAANPTGVSEKDLAIAGFQLQQNYPNPFNPQTTINYSLQNSGQVQLKIYDTLGRLVRTLVNKNIPAGEHSVVWNGRDENGQRVASGNYFYQIKSGKAKLARRMILLK